MAIPLRVGLMERKSPSIFSRQSGQGCREGEKETIAGDGAKEISGGCWSGATAEGRRGQGSARGRGSGSPLAGRPLPLLLGLTGCIRAAYLRGREAPERCEGAKRPSGAERSEAERSSSRMPLRLSVTTFLFVGCTLL